MHDNQSRDMSLNSLPRARFQSFLKLVSATGANTKNFSVEKYPYSKKMKLGAAFTLVELILYVGIVSVMLFTITLSLDAIVKSKEKSRSVSEVEQQGLLVMDTLLRSVRNSNDVTTPSVGIVSTTLSLSVDAPYNPTIFRVSNGTLEIKEGVGDYTALTNNRVEVTGFEVRNISYPNTPDTVRISFSLSTIDPDNRGEYSYTKTFVSSATIRTQ